MNSSESIDMYYNSGYDSMCLNEDCVVKNIKMPIYRYFNNGYTEYIIYHENYLLSTFELIFI